MHCGSVAEPKKLLKCIVENDIKQLQAYLSDKHAVNAYLRFTDESVGVMKCCFTPLATALLYGSDEAVATVLRAGPDVTKMCTFDKSESCPELDDYDNYSVTISMEPAILLTRFLCNFRNRKKWHLLIPLCEAGLDPVAPSSIRFLDPEEEGGSIVVRFSTSVLDEVYTGISLDTFHQLLPYCDISKTLAAKDKIERFYDMIICPARTKHQKFDSIVQHGFQDLSPLPTNFDVFADLIFDRLATAQYTRSTLYCDVFYRVQILMLCCDYKLTSTLNYPAMIKVAPSTDPSEPLDFEFMAAIQDVIFQWNSTPKPLTLLCRNTIRRNVQKPHFVRNVKLLELPQLLEDFVMLPSNGLWRKMGMRDLDAEFNANGSISDVLVPETDTGVALE